MRRRRRRSDEDNEMVKTELHQSLLPFSIVFVPIRG